MPRECVFCAVVGGTAHHVVHSDDAVVAFLDHAPVMKGHTLVVPRAHHETLDDLPDDALVPLFSLVRRVSVALQAALGADGSLVLANTRISQSVPHVHVHVVPRRNGDRLFSPGRTFWIRQRYGPDEAAEIAQKLRRALAEG